MIGVYEYSGIQRCGKSTLMMCDLVNKLLPEYSASDVYANFTIKIEGVHCMENVELIDEIMRMKRDKVRHKVIMFDEAGQELKARGYTDKQQTEVVSFAWQMPKRSIVLMYCSNIGNSADIILRDATWQTILPRYFRGAVREDDYILADIIFNYDMRISRWNKISGFQKVQDLFDSLEAIE